MMGTYFGCLGGQGCEESLGSLLCFAVLAGGRIRLQGEVCRYEVILLGHG